MYTPIISPDDLKTHIYTEYVDEVVRDDDGVTSAAINAAISEAKLYLSRYDRPAMFGDVNLDTMATFKDDFLTSLVKDLACWHLIKLGNDNLNYEHYKTIYDMAIDTFKRIQAGKADPEFPYLDTTGETAPQGNSVFASSVPKRSNHF